MSEAFSLQAEAVGEMNCVGVEVLHRTVIFRFVALNNVLHVSAGVSRVLLPPSSGNRLNPP
jgi:hypothetical protein